MLDKHNEYRQQHGVQSLTLSDSISQTAQAWAEHLNDTGKFQHSRGTGFGENLFFSLSDLPKDPSAVEIVGAWYNETKLYNFQNPGFQSGTGHFTQVVWKATTTIGVGVASSGGKNIVVVNYSPIGNVQGQYEKNVLPPQ